MSSNFRYLLIVLSSTIVILFTTWGWMPQQSLDFNSVNERSEFFRNQFQLLKGSLNSLKSNFETVKETSGDDLIYCDEDVEDFGKEEEKVFSNRNLFDHLTRQLEDEVLSIMTSTSPCSTASSPSRSTSPSTSKTSTRPSPTPRRILVSGEPISLPGGGDTGHQQAELQTVKYFTLLPTFTPTERFILFCNIFFPEVCDILHLCSNKNYFAKQQHVLLVVPGKDHQLLHMIQDPLFTIGWYHIMEY